MNQINLPIPGDFLALKQNRVVNGLDIAGSIRSNILLLLVTHQGESRYDQKFGCSLWEYSFSPLVTHPNLSKEIEEAIKAAIQHYEPRLKDVKVKLALKESIDAFDEIKKIQKQVRMLLTVEIKAKLTQSELPFELKEVIFLDPIATH